MLITWILVALHLTFCYGHMPYYHHNTISPYHDHIAYKQSYTPHHWHPTYKSSHYNYHSHEDGYHSNGMRYYKPKPYYGYKAYYGGNLYPTSSYEGRPHPYYGKEKYGIVPPSYWKMRKYSKMMNPMCKYSVYTRDYWKWKKYCGDYYRRKYQKQYGMDKSPYFSYKEGHPSYPYDMRPKYSSYYHQNTMQKGEDQSINPWKSRGYSMYKSVEPSISPWKTLNYDTRHKSDNPIINRWKSRGYEPKDEHPYWGNTRENDSKYKSYKRGRDDSAYIRRRLAEDSYWDLKDKVGVNRREQEQPFIVEVYDQFDGQQYTHEISKKSKAESKVFGRKLGDLFREIAKGMNPVQAEERDRSPAYKRAQYQSHVQTKEHNRSPAYKRASYQNPVHSKEQSNNPTYNRARYQSPDHKRPPYPNQYNQKPSFPGASCSKYDFSRSAKDNMNGITKYQARSKACTKVMMYTKRNEEVPKILDYLCGKKYHTKMY